MIWSSTATIIINHEWSMSSNTVGFLPNSFGSTSGGICLLLAPSQNKHGTFTTHYMLK